VGGALSMEHQTMSGYSPLVNIALFL
jgi:hypothetical protein